MKLRFLYLPLESSPGDQAGPRRAFEELKKEGLLEAYGVFPFYYEYLQSGNWQAMLNKLYQYAYNFNPSAIYWQLQTTGIVPIEFVKKLKSLPLKPVICQSTGDSYWKPPKSMVQLGKEIEITFLSGTGMMEAFRKAGCRELRLLPEPFDPARFAQPWTPTTTREFNVVMIANRIWSRNPFRIMDGQKERVRLIRALEKRYGNRFAVFGNGWGKITKCWQGAVAYNMQEQTMRRAWLSIATNNWNRIPHYFSDRQFIAMASGVPHVCRYIPGLEDYFEDGKHCLFYRDIKEAIEKCDEILEDPVYYQNSLPIEALKIVLEKHTAKKRALQIIHSLEETRNSNKLGLPMPKAKYEFFRSKDSSSDFIIIQNNSTRS